MRGQPAHTLDFYARYTLIDGTELVIVGIGVNQLETFNLTAKLTKIYTPQELSTLVVKGESIT